MAQEWCSIRHTYCFLPTPSCVRLGRKFQLGWYQIQPGSLEWRFSVGLSVSSRNFFSCPSYGLTWPYWTNWIWRWCIYTICTHCSCTTMLPGYVLFQCVAAGICTAEWTSLHCALSYSKCVPRISKCAISPTLMLLFFYIKRRRWAGSVITTSIRPANT